MVEAGLTSSEVLRSATSGAAKWLGVSGEVGTLREGMRADLIVLNADPLVDIRNTRAISAVIQAGKLVKRP